NPCPTCNCALTWLSNVRQQLGVASLASRRSAWSLKRSLFGKKSSTLFRPTLLNLRHETPCICHQPNWLVKPTPTSFACWFPPCYALRCGLPRALGLWFRAPWQSCLASHLTTCVNA